MDTTKTENTPSAQTIKDYRDSNFFVIAILIFSIIILGVLIANCVYYRKLYNDKTQMEFMKPYHIM